jgi:hypothetical protein
MQEEAIAVQLIAREFKSLVEKFKLVNPGLVK